VDTFLVIGRNAIIVMISIIIFSGFFVAFTNFLIRNTHEEYPEH
jgi:hypothetical protein